MKSIYILMMAIVMLSSNQQHSNKNEHIEAATATTSKQTNDNLFIRSALFSEDVVKFSGLSEIVWHDMW